MNGDKARFTRIGWEDSYATAVWLAALVRLDPSFLVILAIMVYPAGAGAVR